MPTYTDNIPKDFDHTKEPIDKNPTEIKTTISIVYTTIIYTPTPTVYNITNSGSAHQQQQSSLTDNNTISSDNNQTLQESLQDDQQALKRMVMILSLVGGLGVTAIFATIFIFTRMRMKNKKQRGFDDRIDGLSQNMSRSDSNQDNRSNSHGVLMHPTSSEGSLSSSSSNRRLCFEPSAPPAPLIVESSDNIILINNTHTRQNVISMSSQTTSPSPSAPTAKELDAMVDGEEVSNEATTSFQHVHNINNAAHMNTCLRCTPLMMPPELPPPAYTPSAPPHYLLPVEPIILTTSPSSNSINISRRHSIGN